MFQVVLCELCSSQRLFFDYSVCDTAVANVMLAHVLAICVSLTLCCDIQFAVCEPEHLGCVRNLKRRLMGEPRGAAPRGTKGTLWSLPVLRIRKEPF